MFDRLFAGLRPPRKPRTAYERGVEALEGGLALDALAAFSEAAEGAPTDLERAAALNKKGVALVALARRPAALETFCEALAIVERFPPALVNLGNLLLEDGHLQDAIDYYEAALRADEKSALAHRNLGVALKQLGRRADAVRHLRAAARLESRRSPERG